MQKSSITLVEEFIHNTHALSVTIREDSLPTSRSKLLVPKRIKPGLLGISPNRALSLELCLGGLQVGLGPGPRFGFQVRGDGPECLDLPGFALAAAT